MEKFINDMHASKEYIDVIKSYYNLTKDQKVEQCKDWYKCKSVITHKGLQIELTIYCHGNHTQYNYPYLTIKSGKYFIQCSLYSFVDIEVILYEFVKYYRINVEHDFFPYYNSDHRVHEYRPWIPRINGVSISIAYE